MIYNIYILAFLLILTQCIYGKPIEYPQKDVDAMLDSIKGTDIGEKLILLRLVNYETLPQQYAAIVANATEYLLKDAALRDNNEPEVVEFRQKLNQFLEKYDPSANHKATHEAMNIYFNIIQHYLENPVIENATKESKFIIELLNKYNFEENIKKFHVIRQIFQDLKTNRTVGDKFLVYILDNFAIIPQKYNANAANTTQFLLKDKSLQANDKPFVMEFKNKLNLFLKHYDALADNMTAIYNSMDEFADITEHYYGLKEDEITEDSKFVIDLLNKYNCRNMAMRYTKHLELFLEEFTKKFEENKKDLDKSFWVWYDNFVTLTDLEERLVAILEFMKLVKDN